MNAFYTREVFSKSLQALLETYSLKDIRINDICSACGLSKRTFYYHFKDKYDLAVYLAETLYHEAIPSDILPEDASYFSMIQHGDPAFVDADPENPVVVIQSVNFFTEQKRISRNAATNLFEKNNEINSPYRVRKNAALEGRRNYILKKLSKRNTSLAPHLLSLAVEQMVETSYYFYDLWFQKIVSENDAKELADVLINLTDFWADYAEHLHREKLQP